MCICRVVNFKCFVCNTVDIGTIGDVLPDPNSVCPRCGRDRVEMGDSSWIDLFEKKLLRKISEKGASVDTQSAGSFSDAASEMAKNTGEKIKVTTGGSH